MWAWKQTLATLVTKPFYPTGTSNRGYGDTAMQSYGKEHLKVSQSGMPCCPMESEPAQCSTKRSSKSVRLGLARGPGSCMLQTRNADTCNCVQPQQRSVTRR
eukprot:scaffold4768_cov19-Tisochrysis_lutea.AAC.1